jgi:hypothetical protein
MQNKANFRKVKLNVTEVITKDYEKKNTWWSGKNKPNSNPKQTQFKPNQSQNKPNTKSNKPNPPALTMVNHLVRRVEIPYKSSVAFPKQIAILMTNGTRRRRPALQTLTDGFQSLVFTTK